MHALTRIFLKDFDAPQDRPINEKKKCEESFKKSIQDKKYAKQVVKKSNSGQNICKVSC